MSLKTSFRLVIKPPMDCSANERAAFRRCVLRGGEANLSLLDDGLNRAFYFGFAYVGDRLVSVCAMKHSDVGHQNDVFARAGIPTRAPLYSHEIGYVYTEPEYRHMGICTTLAADLLSRTSEPVFASTRVMNKPALRLLLQLGFTPVGHRFLGRHPRPQKYYVMLLARL